MTSVCDVYFVATEMKIITFALVVISVAKSLHSEDHCVYEDGLLICSKIKIERFERLMGNNRSVEAVVVRDSYIPELANGTLSSQDNLKELTITG